MDPFWDNPSKGIKVEVSSPPPQEERLFLHVVPDSEGGQYTISKLREAAKKAGVPLFRERSTGQEGGGFYVERPVPKELLPWVGADARRAEENWRAKKEAYRLLLEMAARSEVPKAGQAVALPDPVKDPAGYIAARSRLLAMPAEDREKTKNAVQLAANMLPEEKKRGLIRALEVLEQAGNGARKSKPSDLSR